MLQHDISHSIIQTMAPKILALAVAMLNRAYPAAPMG